MTVWSGTRPSNVLDVVESKAWAVSANDLSKILLAALHPPIDTS
jgi:hypothetical protein